MKSTDAGAPGPPRRPGRHRRRPSSRDPLRARQRDTCLISSDERRRVLRLTPAPPVENPARPISTSMTAVVTPISPSPADLRDLVRHADGAVGVGCGGATVSSADVGGDTDPVVPLDGRPARRGAIALGRLRATNAKLIHAAGDNGKLARSIDGGKSGGSPTCRPPRTSTDVSFPDANTGFAVDTYGGLRFTPDGGARWTPLDTGTVPSIAARVRHRRNTAMLFTSKGIFRSTRGKRHERARDDVRPDRELEAPEDGVPRLRRRRHRAVRVGHDAAGSRPTRAPPGRR